MSLVSVVIPARNEGSTIKTTLDSIRKEFEKNSIDFELIVVNDGSTDNTQEIVSDFSIQDKRVNIIKNNPPYGFGYAIRKGLQSFKGDMVIIAMADSSDDPCDMVKYVNGIKEGYDCCFGTRWVSSAVVEGYPPLKYYLNRTANWVIKILFGIKYNDVTNAFKAYSRSAIAGINPVLSRHFNITVELPLKAIVRGYDYKIIPTSWHERRKGKTKFKLQEMGSRYLFIIIYVLLEKLLCGNDYKKINQEKQL